MINVYPFNSKEVVLLKDNKAVTENSEGSLHGFIALETDKVDPDLYGVDYINAHHFDSILGHIDFFTPVCDDPRMTPAVNRVYRNDLENLLEEKNITPDQYTTKRVEVHEKYLQQLQTLGISHVIYGFTYGDNGDPKEIMLECENLEKEILQLN